MQDTQSFFPDDLYLQHLSTIRDIPFTHREVDVMACLLGGRKTSKIAYLLSINPRTVETYIQNITLKLECNTREGIIDFLELSEQIPFLRKHYLQLQIDAAFRKGLTDLSKLIRIEHSFSVFISGEKKALKSPLVPLLKSHLKLAGLIITNEGVAEGRYLIYVLPPQLQQFPLSLYQIINQYPKNKILLVLEQDKQELPKELKGFKIINITKHQNYYFYFFDVIKILFPNIKIDHIISNFKEKYEKVQDVMKSEYSPQTFHQPHYAQRPFLESVKDIMFARPLLFGITLLIIALIIIGFLNFYWHSEHESQQQPLALSELPLPTKSVFLERPELLREINKSFTKEGDIQIVALVGIGGSGKTTLARQYAPKQKANIVWEINAQTRGSLYESFENLAHTLAKKEEDKKILKELLETKNSKEKKEKLISFVKERFKSHSPWFLIFDNVENFADIQEYFPQNINIWEKGNIILTTRNNNIQNNSQIDKIILIGELTSNQKLSLFTTIMNHAESRKLTVTQQNETLEFLKQLPPFPLDISVAAYYLKTMNISYEKYLEYLSQQNRDFTLAQENLLKEAGEYTKTRYRIITLSLKKLMETHKDFPDLLLFISLLDSQNIPRDLLGNYKNDAIVDNLIYHLKKHSLIMSESVIPSLGSALSIHRSTQAISLAFFTKTLNLEKNYHSTNVMGNALKTYMRNICDKEDTIKMKGLIEHCEVFLSHSKLISKTMNGIINGELGFLYYNLSRHNKKEKALKKSILTLEKCVSKDHPLLFRPFFYLGIVYWGQGEFEKAKTLFEKSIRIYNKFNLKDYNGICRALTYLGIFYQDQGSFEKAHTFLQQGLQIYKTSNSKNYSGLAFTLMQLGSAYTGVGNYIQAKIYLEKSLAIHKKYCTDNNPMIGWNLGNLGRVYMIFGDFEKAELLNKQNLTIYKKHYPLNSLNVAWVLRNLGAVYCEGGNFKDAQPILEESVAIFSKFLGENNIKTKWAYFELGKVYKGFGNLTKAKIIFEDCLRVYEKVYENNWVIIGGVLREIGELYLLEGNLKLAEDFLNQSLDIFQKNKHPSTYKCLENFAALHLKKSEVAAGQNDMQSVQEFKNQAINDLKRALEIVKTHFPEDSPHKIRIQGKLNKL